MRKFWLQIVALTLFSAAVSAGPTWAGPLQISTSANRTTAAPGQEVQFTIDVATMPSVVATNVSVEFFPGTDLQIEPNSITLDGQLTSSVSLAGGILSVGFNVLFGLHEITLKALVSPTAKAGSHTSVAIIAAPGMPAEASFVDITVAQAGPPIVSIGGANFVFNSWAPVPATVGAGQPTTLTGALTNIGTATGVATITIHLPSPLTPLGLPMVCQTAGCTIVSAGVTQNSSTGQIDVTFSTPSVAPTETISVFLVVQAGAPLTALQALIQQALQIFGSSTVATICAEVSSGKAITDHACTNLTIVSGVPIPVPVPPSNPTCLDQLLALLGGAAASGQFSANGVSQINSALQLAVANTGPARCASFLCALCIVQAEGTRPGAADVAAGIEQAILCLQQQAGCVSQIPSPVQIGKGGKF